MMRLVKPYKFRTAYKRKKVDSTGRVGYNLISPTLRGLTMLDFVILFIPAFLVMVTMKMMFSHDITPKEVGIHLIAIIIGAAAILGVNYYFLYSDLQDVEVLNGEVTGKYKHTEICTELSSCENYTVHQRCTSSTDDKGNTTESCVSYKVFDYDSEFDWYVESTVGEIKIRRVNARGDIMPDRYRVVRIGEPASAPHRYTNYLFADEQSLFAPEDFKTKYDPEYQKGIPDYPGVFDYYRTDHIVNLTRVSSKGYNEYVSEVLKTEGSRKQLNITVVLYNDRDPQFVDATMTKWRGGKKNDVLMFFGVNDSGDVTKFYSTSFAGGMKNEMLHATLRIDALSEKMSLDLLKKQVYTTVQKYERLPNEEFKYMKYRLEPKKEIIVACSVVLLLISICIGFFMRNNDL